MNSNNRNWTREETILAFELYCKIPSGKDTVTNPLIITLAHAIGRTASSVKLKLQNFKSYDPSYVENGRIGLAHGSRLDAQISAEFFQNWDALVLETNEIKRRFAIPLFQPEVMEYESTPFIGSNELQIQKIRIGQTFFRQTLLSIYENKCCITGISIPDLLRASHIKPWAKSNDVNEKTNPRNGLLLNALFDAAFDRGYITINGKYMVVLSSKISEYADNNTKGIFKRYDKQIISLPNRFLPDMRFVEYHNDMVFLG